ncbi:MAG: translation initiation factor IF-2 [Vicinamibacterales bacterium]
MSTVRIYRVAELLNASSQEVMELLRREHGIEVKSASSTIEEVVARQFVERQARSRGLTIPPPSKMFLETTPVTKGKKGPAKAEATKPAPPTLPPPRLVRVVRPPTPTEHGAEHPAAAAFDEHQPASHSLESEAHVAAVALVEDVEVLEPIEAAPQSVEAELPAETPAAPLPVVEEPVVAAQEPAAAVMPSEEEVVAAVEPAASAVAQPGAEEPPQPAGEPAAQAARPLARPSPPTGRMVPPSIRLRIEDPSAPTVEGPSARVVPPRQAPAARPPHPAPARPAAAAGPAAGTGSAVRPGTPPPLGGPRPLPQQPVRPAGTVRSPLTSVRPSYAPTGYTPAARPAAPPGAQPPRPPAAGPRPPQQPFRPRPTSRPHGRRDQAQNGRPGFGAPSAPSGPPPITRSITLAEGMTVKDLSDKLDVKVKDVLKKVLEKGKMMTINSTLDADMALMIAREFGADVQMRSFEEEVVEVESEASNPEDRVTRAPVVTVMGHVDHGKTTLLDAIRETRVAEREAGGITQHIGAYAVEVNKRKVVFLDTPGHEAFTLMRARGAKVTDVVVLVVAADDGVMPQTREAIDHARAANVPIVVAVNKVDKADANPERVKKELSDLGLVPEEWGGQTVLVPVSAKKRQNIDSLLEMILLVTEIAELKANPKRNASGTVLEAKLDKGRGPVATVLVQDGTLHVGDTFIAGTIVGKVRALIDDRGVGVRDAAPSTPVEVLGLGGLPQPGDTFQVLEDAAKARQIVVFRQEQAKQKALSARSGRVTVESLQQLIAEGGVKELAIIIKADVQGSAEVLADTLTKLSDERVKVSIIHTGVGAINESDVLLASASNAIVIGFNVRPDRNAADVAEREQVEIRLHSVIYNVVDEMKNAMLGLLEPTFKEVRLGSAEVRQVFRVPKVGSVAGCMVLDGVIKRSGEAQARLIRDHVLIHEGKLASLKRFKDDVGEVKAGFECGLSFERYQDVKLGDIVEVFTVVRAAAPAAN